VNSHAVLTGVYAGALLAVTGVVAWATGTPFVFPSLGPTAYLLASQRTRDRGALARVVAGHAVGVVAGLGAYHALAPRRRRDGLARAAVAGTGRAGRQRRRGAGADRYRDARARRGPPAGLREGVLIGVAVVVLVGVHVLTTRVTPATATG
jgi:hypothetical protein